MKWTMFLVLFLSIQVFGNQTFIEDTLSLNSLKPRIIILTDISTWEPDDHESLIRLLAHADLFEIEGIVFSTGWSIDNTGNHPQFIDIIHGVIDAYEEDLPNFIQRSNQEGHSQDTTKQKIGYWPSAEYLRDRTMNGSQYRGMEFIGANNNSNGSNLIIEQVDEEDSRPIWVTFWGGGNTLAQAIWQVKQNRNEEEFKSFLNKLRAYAITDQDREINFEGKWYEKSSHQWLRREFADDLLFIWDECAWIHQNGTGRDNWSEYETHIQGHGNLGRQYPKYKYGVEGDTPAFLHLLPNGLNNPNDPTQCGWGGYSVWKIGADNTTYAFTNNSDSYYNTCLKYNQQFYQATFNNFAARMDWAKNGTGNRNPIVVINDDHNLDVITISPETESTIQLDASLSYDPDGDSLSFNWWMQPEAGTYSKDILIAHKDSNVVNITVPADANGKTFHVICEVTDNGTHNLTSYRRIIAKPSIDGSDSSINLIPVAYAGPNQTVIDSDENNYESVILYGSGSNDFDGSVSSYSWSENGVEFATEPITQVNLPLGKHIITLTVTDTEGATDTDDVIITVNEKNINNIRSLQKKKVLIYPNPASGLIGIDFNDYVLDNGSLSIYNSKGNLVKYVPSLNKNNIISISGLPSGQYILVIESFNNQIYEKLIIN